MLLKLYSERDLNPFKMRWISLSLQGSKLATKTLLFVVGDLNYRLEGIPGDDVRRLLMLHTRKEY